MYVCHNYMTFLFILAHSTDCQGLYDEDVPSYAMKTGRHVITVGLERTKDLKLQDIKVSWSKLKNNFTSWSIFELKAALFYCGTLWAFHLVTILKL